jgi:hypothetical protein
MAYVFDPTTNTLIDDEDKSLGNKLALNQDEFQKLLDIPGVFRASEAPQPPERPDVKEIEAINRFMRDNPIEKAEGGKIGGGVIAGKNFGDRTGFANPVSPLNSPEVLKRIIELHQKNKLGAEAIAKVLTEELGFQVTRSPVGKQLTKLKAQGLITDIPVSEKAASIAMRGDLYGQSPGEKYLKIREIRNVDKLRYNIPENFKFKVNFGNTGANFADVTNIPKEFIGVQYFKTKEAAEKALAKRKKLKLIGDVDPDPIRRSANKKKYNLIKEVSNNNIERILADFKKGQPLEQAHRLSLNQVKKTGEMYNVMNLGLDFDDPRYVQINNKLVKPYENKLKQLYTEQNNLYKKAKNLKVIPKDLQQKIQFNNQKISTVVDLAGSRVQGLQLDELTLKPKTYGVNYANVLGFGLYDKPVTELTDVDRAGIATVMQGQIENEKKTAGKTAQKLFENKKFLKNIDVLATTGKILKTAGKVIKPLGYAIGPYALASANAKADEMGIELNLMDKIKAFDSGDADVAIDSWKRRNDPEFAAAERAKDLAQMEDDFEEVGLNEIKPDETIQEFMAHGGRVGLKNGGAAGADVNFATELEYLLTNPDVDLPEIQTYTETKNPIQIFNDIINPRNYPYYADVLARSGIRIGEFGIRLIPAAGKLISDAIQKGPFRIKESKNSGYAQDFGKILLADFEGTGIFSEFLKNITPTSLEKKVGLDKIIKKEEQRLKDTGSTVGPKVFADTLGLGAEVAAPVFPGLKIAQKALTTKKVTDLPDIPKPSKSSEKVEDLDSIENLESNIAKIKILNEVEPLDPATKITRLLAEKILTKKGIKIGDKDPIDVYVDVYGEIITDVKNLAEDILEADLQGRSLKSIDELLEIEGLFNVPIPKEPFKGIPVDDTIQMLEKDVREKKILDSFSTKGKTKNAKGGIIK